MKTAKEITEHLTALEDEEETDNRHLVYVPHYGTYKYRTMVDTLEKLRNIILENEYYPYQDKANEGIEDALRWVLGDSK